MRSTIDAILNVLRAALAADEPALRALFETRVYCDGDAMEKAGFVVTTDNRVGCLGMLNGVVFAATGEVVVAEFDADGDRILGFGHKTPEEYHNDAEAAVEGVRRPEL